MRIARQHAGGLAVFFAAVFFVSCAQPYHDPGEKYIFVAANTSQPYWLEARAGFMDAARTLGVKVEMAGPEKLSPNDELTTLQNAVMMHPAGILIAAAPPNPEMFRGEIQKAITQEIPVICIDTDLPESGRFAFIGTDNFQAGIASVQRMAKILKEQGDVLIVGNSNEPAVVDRMRGASEGLKNHTGVRIAGTLNDKGDSQSASDQIVAALQSKEKVDGIVALDAPATQGALDALHRLNRDSQIPIVAFGKDPEILDGIARGTITASIGPKPYIMAYYGVKFLDDLHHFVVHQMGDWRSAPSMPLPRRVDVGTDVIDRSNVSFFLDALAKNSHPQ
jgi:ribose transport system substrate-binding protein